MFNIFKTLFTSAVLLGSLQASATIITHNGSGTAVTNASHTATFDSLTSGASLSNYVENGLSIFVDDTHGSFNGVFYGSGGNDSFVTIATQDGSDFFGLEFDVYSGSSRFNNMVWQTFRDGVETGSGLLRDVNAFFYNNVAPTVTLGWSDVDLFDTIRVGLGVSRHAGFGTGVDYTAFGQSNLIALDNVKIDLGAASTPTPSTPVPEPAAFALLGVGLAFMVGKRRKNT